jgi:hypothetical protein
MKKRHPNQTKSIREVIAIDRRNSKMTVKSKHNVRLIRVVQNGIVFCAGLQFPVPACRRRYYMNGRELAVEECGKVPGRDLFQFAGMLVS